MYAIADLVALAKYMKERPRIELSSRFGHYLIFWPILKLAQLPCLGIGLDTGLPARCKRAYGGDGKSRVGTQRGRSRRLSVYSQHLAAKVARRVISHGAAIL
jgi:hypothetical protein